MYHTYAILNIVNDRVYIGQTKREKLRQAEHFRELREARHKNPYLQRAWSYYGEQAFAFFFISDHDTRDESSEAEKFYISWYKALKLSYNNLDGGDGCCNPDDETRAKMRAAKVGKPQTEEHKAKYTGRPSARKGVPVSEEARAKMRAKKLGGKLTDQHKAKLAAALAKRVFTPETRVKQSKAARGNQHCLGRVASPETRQKLRDAFTGRLISKEQKQKISETMTGRKLTEEHKSNVSAATKGRPGKPLSEETKQKIREARARQVMKPMSEETKCKISEATTGKLKKKRANPQ